MQHVKFLLQNLFSKLQEYALKIFTCILLSIFKITIPSQERNNPKFASFFSAKLIVNRNKNDCLTTKLAQDALETFLSAICSCCKVFPATHRCRKKIFNEKVKFQGNWICGTSFFGLWLLEQGTEDSTLC